MTWWVYEVAEGLSTFDLVAWIFWVLLSITLHELAHGWAAIRQGDDTPLRRGRMTLNPIVQMGLPSLVIFALCGIAWGAMPVTPQRFRDGRKGEAIVAAAGPAMNLLLAAISAVLLAIWLWVMPAAETVTQYGAILFRYGVFLNILLAGLNLLPIPPLDGSRIIAAFSRPAREMYDRPEAPMIGMVVFMAVFFFSPVGTLLFGGAMTMSDRLINLVGTPLNNPHIGVAMRAGPHDLPLWSLSASEYEALINDPSSLSLEAWGDLMGIDPQDSGSEDAAAPPAEDAPDPD